MVLTPCCSIYHLSSCLRFSLWWKVQNIAIDPVKRHIIDVLSSHNIVAVGNCDIFYPLQLLLKAKTVNISWQWLTT